MASLRLRHRAKLLVKQGYTATMIDAEAAAAHAASDRALFPYFQDIVELCHAEDTGDATLDIDEDDLDEEQQHAQLDASSFPMDAIQKELKKRNLKPRGFFNEDASLLQEQFDQEFEQAREEKRQQRIAKQERLERERQEAMIDKEMLLERQELDHDEELSTLLASMKQGKSPQHANINLKLVTTAFGFCSPNCNLVYLDVSNQGLCDVAGAYICRSLSKNTSLKKIELSNNRLGPMSFQELGRGLMNNKTVEFVSLDCNPLRGSENGGDDDTNLFAARSLADMIGRNSTLRHLGLWQCFMGAESGKLIANALESCNTTLTTLKCGCNSWDDKCIRRIDAKLGSNREARNKEREKEAARKREEELRRIEQQRLDEERKRKLANEQWLEEQKKIRAEQRRLKMEAENKARVEREKAEEEERQRLAAEEAAKLAAKKAKALKKKAKKK